MAGYPNTETESRYSWETLLSFVAAIFERSGMHPADARLLAETLVQADLRGCHSHGVLRVPEYVHKLQKGGVNPRGVPRAVSERGGAVVVDGGNSMGQIASAFAMDKAIGKARGSGVAVAAVRGSNHCGALAYFAMMALRNDMIGLATTNALPTMAPWGGTGKIVGINPLAVAVPAGEEDAIVIDAAFSASSHGKIRIYQQKGLAIPDNWAFDADGQPTTDPAAAIDGLLRPIGDYKGVGLAVVMGVLSATLSGASYGTDLGSMTDGPHPGRDGQFLMALDVAAFVDAGEFKRQVDRIVRQIRASRLAPGFDQVFSPGELEAVNERRYRIEGIPLNPNTVDDLITCAASLGLDTPLWSLDEAAARADSSGCISRRR
jgi:LDH2 family malate/lactate/ureidoglycolate dehydrogenase